MSMNFIHFLATGGLQGVEDSLVNNWIGPAFFIVVAGFAIKFAISRQFRELGAFLGIAAVVALLVFNAEGLFGSNGIFKGIADGFANLIGGGGGGSGSGTGTGTPD